MLGAILARRQRHRELQVLSMTHLTMKTGLLTYVCLLVGCGSQNLYGSHSQARIGYVEDSQSCWSLSPLIEAASPSQEADRSEKRYLQCLSDRGYQQKRESDPLLVAIKRCKSEGGKVFLASGEAYRSEATAASIDACLMSRGFTKSKTTSSRERPPYTGHDQKLTGSQQDPGAGSLGDVRTVIIAPR